MYGIGKGKSRIIATASFCGGELNKPNKQTHRDKDALLAGPVKRWFATWERLLEGKEYFVGGAFTAADLAVYEIAETAASATGAPIDEYPKLKALVQRIGARPKIAAYTGARKW